MSTHAHARIRHTGPVRPLNRRERIQETSTNGRLLLKWGRNEKLNEVVVWASQVANSSPSSDTPSLQMLPDRQSKQLGTGLDASDRGLLPKSDEYTVKEQSHTPSTQPDVCIDFVTQTAPSDIDSHGPLGGAHAISVLYYWHRIAPYTPEARSLALRLRLLFPVTQRSSHLVSLGIKYPVFRLIATGQDTPENLATLLGPD
ncbi:hypothetical protein HBH56_009670 [Parastagonospora nodorum]|uniref:Uncharacterized protein n=2 Tax=Phaeosphaeria nodorum (strain SN15 / ATCC MYA-4574 / FGSC 10173) TaxID=321614 RepID=A0A7U2EPN6_PHANO|nr:hypothetical protein SNOG_00207 [Parastagonospora nodorum SN15]KAH3920777.1 hypothetical protein HBH56_009670 [Parastagonospora nodorum]EAT91702.1 hypothetical protein SNOG_00207 [Parastagonospora nodorum SN15]KAH3935245.1 hypothetical protein HBH54_042970 [Parastagonospora nodorum]KAH4145930.1 hypothetical protein HBH45_002770 [Parastagonospora nodorum]KAH4170031.1 hypothetical protein HBH44_033380 [Parastagonospora nodorum]